MSIIFGKYRLIKMIATGGMAEVYLAHQTGISGFQKLIIIKKILREFNQNEDFINMFTDEARISGYLNHPNIAQVYETGSVSGQHFLAMEFIDGCTLKELMDKVRSSDEELPLEIILKLVSGALLGLDYAHEAKDFKDKRINIIHRDISPHNIMVSIYGGVKIIDFGIAKATVKVQQTQGATIKGKCNYMSPEQVKGKTLDGRSDLFSMAIVLYELITGKTPFEGDEILQIIDNILQKDADLDILGDVDDELRAILKKGLEKDPEKRFQTGSEFHEVLETYMAKKGMVVSQVKLTQFIRRFTKSVMDNEKLRDSIRESSESLAESQAAGETAQQEEQTRMVSGEAQTDSLSQPVPPSTSSIPKRPLSEVEQEFNKIEKTLTKMKYLPPSQRKKKGLIDLYRTQIVFGLVLALLIILGIDIAQDHKLFSFGANKSLLDEKPALAKFSKGSLEIRTQPLGAKLFVNGKPFNGDSLEMLPGKKYLLKVTKNGFKDYEGLFALDNKKQTRKMKVILEPNQADLFSKVRFVKEGQENSRFNLKVILRGRVVARSLPSDLITIDPFNFYDLIITFQNGQKIQSLLGPVQPSQHFEYQIGNDYKLKSRAALTRVEVFGDSLAEGRHRLWLSQPGQKDKMVCILPCRSETKVQGSFPVQFQIRDEKQKVVKSFKVENSLLFKQDFQNL